jgi:ribosomal protein L7/L12
MAVVKVQGWRVGFNKVESTKIIRAATGLGLAEGKAITDAILTGEVQLIHVVSESAAHELARDLSKIGANASVDAA